LGFNNYSHEFKKWEVYADRPVNLLAGLNTLFVYSNVVAPQLVGNVEAPLLRSFDLPHKAEFGHQVTVNFEDSNYIPVAAHDFESIVVGIKNESGDSVDFKFGSSRLKLHFRKSHVISDKSSSN
jgi:hypothetical protein